MPSIPLIINGNELCCEAFGRDDAPVLIALHGAPGIGWRDEPRETFKIYSDMYRVIVFDMRGSGHSSGNAPLSHAAWVSDIESLREWAKADTIVLAGGSYGGFIALEYAVRYPTRLRGLVLRDTAASNKGLNETAIEHARTSTRVRVDIKRLKRLLQGRIRDNEELKAVFKEILPLYTYRHDPSQAEEVIKGCIFRFQTHNAAFRDEQPNFDVTEGLRLITCPTLVTVGRADWACTVQMSETITSHIPDSSLIIFEQSGHSPQVEERELWHWHVRDFLRKAVYA